MQAGDCAMQIKANGVRNSGVLIDLTKIQKINNNQALFTIQLDDKMI
jgi:hypothetical protein